MNKKTYREFLIESGMRTEEVDYLVSIQELGEKLYEKDPSLGITAHIIAGDMMSAEYATKRVKNGENPESALVFVGSYARFGWAVDNLTDDQLFPRIGELWRGADPDDTDPRFLEVWKRAWEANGRKTITDGKPLPKGILTVHRGQDADAPMGIAWTLDRATAEKFAQGAGLRQRNRGGTILTAKIDGRRILGYLTERGESECIIDPSDPHLLLQSSDS